MIRGLVATSLLLGALLSTAPVSAQGTQLLAEDFESPQFPPAGWTVLSTIPPVWGVLEAGYCGAPTRAAGFVNPNTCTYWTPWGAGGALISPAFTTQAASTVFEFDYTLAMDPFGDSVDVQIEDLSTPGVFLDVAPFASLANDGLPHHVLVSLPLPPGTTWKLFVWANADGVGDLMSGLRIDDIVVTDGVPVLSYCPGDGSGSACPCGNTGSSGAGCANSTGAGALLATSGSTSVALDDLVIELTHAPALHSAIVFEGSGPNTAGYPFHDGLLCVTPPVRRLRLGQTSASGALSFGPGFIAASGWSAGTARYVQSWFRDGGGPCGTSSNTSNALELHLLP